MKKENNSKAIKKLKELDKTLYRHAKDIKILDSLSWGLSVKREFLKKWKVGNPVLPKVSYKPVDNQSKKEILRDIIKKCDVGHPIGALIRDTARSYFIALSMIENRGKRSFLTLSDRLYRSPHDDLDLQTSKVAVRYLASIKAFDKAATIPEQYYCLRAQDVAKRIKRSVKQYMPERNIKVEVVKKLASKASASPNIIKLRDATCFSENDIDQLINHELLTHTLTITNGREQPFKVLGLNAPRATMTQEGLAIFSEFITNSIDVSRLKRISARVQAIELAREGANFIDIFEFFLNLGDSLDESYFSAQRVFRGGNPKGKIVFTKDTVYLKGFILVHRFFIEALKTEKLDFPQYLLSGRMSVDDVESLSPLFESNVLHKSRCLPDWISQRSKLLAYLLSSSVMDQLGLNEMH